MKLAVLFSEGLPELERKAFFEDFFEFSADNRTSNMAFQLSMEMANKRKLALHNGRLQYRQGSGGQGYSNLQAPPEQAPPDTVSFAGPNRDEMEALMTHDEIDALKRGGRLPARGKVGSIAATVGSNPNSVSGDNGSEYVDGMGGAAADGNTDAVFNALRSTIYREVAVVIAYNESRPNFLVRFFRLLQCLTSDYIRDRALVMLQDLVASVLPDDDEDPEEQDLDESTVAMRERYAATGTHARPEYSAGTSQGSAAYDPNAGELAQDDSFYTWDEEEQALFKVPNAGNPVVRHRSYDYAELADVGTDVPSPDEDGLDDEGDNSEGIQQYNWTRKEQYTEEYDDEEAEEAAGVAATLAEEFQQDIEGNQTVLLGVARYLESLSGPNGVFTEAVITNVSEVILQQTTVTAYLAQVGGDQQDVNQLRLTLHDSLGKFTGQMIGECQTEILKELGDILYDEMIFYKGAY
jgi:hypothetical protein